MARSPSNPASRPPSPPPPHRRLLRAPGPGETPPETQPCLPFAEERLPKGLSTPLPQRSAPARPQTWPPFIPASEALDLEEYELNDFALFEEIPRKRLLRATQAVVQVEGPVHQERIAHLLLLAQGAGDSRPREILGVLKPLFRELWHGDEVALTPPFLSLPGQKAPLRSWGHISGLDLEWISPEEWQRALALAVGLGGFPMKEQHLAHRMGIILNLNQIPSWPAFLSSQLVSWSRTGLIQVRPGYISLPRSKP